MLYLQKAFDISIERRIFVLLWRSDTDIRLKRPLSWNGSEMHKNTRIGLKCYWLNKFSCSIVVMNGHIKSGTKVGSWSIIASCKPPTPLPASPTALRHSAFCLFASYVIVCCCYDNLATPREFPTAYFRAVSFCCVGDLQYRSIWQSINASVCNNVIT